MFQVPTECQCQHAVSCWCQAVSVQRSQKDTKTSRHRKKSSANYECVCGGGVERDRKSTPLWLINRQREVNNANVVLLSLQKLQQA